jgi:putative ABC transport system substrate-binding protein
MNVKGGRMGAALTRRVRADTARRSTRRALILAVTFFMLAVCLPALAQRQVKMPRVGLLLGGAASQPSPNVEAFRKGLRELGYIEGKNIVLEYRYAEARVERLPELAAELVRLPVDVIVTAGGPAISAAREATSTIPIIFTMSGNPMATGYVANLARPGGNVTGLSTMAADLSAKRLELLKEIAGKASLVAVLWNPDNGEMRSRMREVQAASKPLAFTIRSLEVRVPDDFSSVFALQSQSRPDALLVMADPLTDFHRNRIVEQATKLRLPAIYETRSFVDAGGLMSYGPSLSENHRRAAAYVDKILKGTKAGDLPVELPSKFELVINRKAAKALGVTVPQQLLLRADEVIE